MITSATVIKRIEKTSDAITFDPARGFLPKVPPAVAAGKPDIVPVPNCTLTFLINICISLAIQFIL